MLAYKILYLTLSSTIALLVLTLAIYQALEGFERPVVGPTIEPGPVYEYVYETIQFSAPYRVMVVELQKGAGVEAVRVYVNGRLYVNPEGLVECGSGPCSGFIQVIAKSRVPYPVVYLRAYTGHVELLAIVLALASLALLALLWVARRGGGLHSLG